MAEVIEQVQGSDRDHQVVIRDRDGAPVATYTLANPLSATLWRGDAQSVLATPAVAWDDPSLGTCTVRVARADLAGLEPGLYHLQAFVDEPDGSRECFLDAELRVLASAGSGTPPKVYCSADDMAVYFPSDERLQGEADQTGYAEQRAEARDEIVAMIEQCWDGRKSDAEISHWAECRPGFSAKIVLGSYPAASPPRDLPWLRAVLAADGLVVTSAVRKMAALTALSIVLEAQVAETAIVAAGRSSAYQQLADRFAARIDTLKARFVAEIDADGDGVVDLTIDCRSRALIR